ncbi:MAG: Uma2 family endonuclease [Chitinophagales bacterium]
MQVIPQSKKKKWTLQEYYKTPEGVYFEIIHGIKYMAPSPFKIHQQVSRDLSYLLITYTRKYDLGEILQAPLDVVLADDTVVQPDLIYISKDNKLIQGDTIKGTPDALMEIISAGSVKKDREIKMKLYCEAGVPEYWLIEPDHRSVEIYHLENGLYKRYCYAAESGQVTSIAIAGFVLNVGELFPVK